MEKFQKPRFLIVMEQIKQEIKEGRLLPGERLPSENEYAKQLNVSRATLREALRLLEEEHVIQRKHGVGTFINSKPVFSSGIEELSSITDMIRLEGKQPGTEVLLSKYVEAEAIDKQRLNLEEDERIFLIKRVRTADGTPLVYCIDKLPAHLFKKETHLLGGSLFDFMEQHNVVISYATADIKTVSYEEEISEKLHCDHGNPLLVLKQLHFTATDEPVLYSTNYFRSDRFSFNVLRKRTGY